MTLSWSLLPAIALAIFLLVVGIVDIAQKYGYLKSENQKKLDQTINDTAQTVQRLTSMLAEAAAAIEHLRQVRSVVDTVAGDVTTVRDLIQRRSNEQRMEQILELERDVLAEVRSHTGAVARLDQVHPPARFESGEMPAHWCAVRTIVGPLNEIKAIVAHTETICRGDAQKDLDALVKIVTLLGTTLERTDAIAVKQAEILRRLDSFESS